MALRNNLKLWREAARMTIEQLASRANTSGATISRIEAGAQQPRPGLLSRICSIFGQPQSAFYAAETNVTPVPMGDRRIPVLDYVQAGHWRGMAPNLADDDCVWTERRYSADAFGLRIAGDSMEPRFVEGDMVIIDPNIPPRANDFVVAHNGGDQATFKQYKDRGIDAYGKQIFALVPLNDGYPTLRSDLHKMEIVGTMVEHRQYARR